MSQQPTLIATTRVRITIFLISAAALALSACTGPAGAEPSASPAPVASELAIGSPTPSPTSSATATYKPASEDGPAENVPVPELPEAATEKTEEGLTEFSAYWLETMTYAYATGDLEPMKAISGANCTACINAAQTIETSYSDGGWMVGGGLTPASSKTNFKQTPEGEYQIVFQHRQEALDVYLMDGTHEIKSDPVDSSVMIMIAAYDGGHWVAKNVETIGK
ncbi:DUF6318 family protein [Arthrobacter sulfonylureivorans]|uniref:DUF6318 family protein n=1 Tax=Arthrobacter sulfonylureivorans TaxID=2486855 RepID=A0ABY3W4M6_9MICC|nr:DUF6318 family protein [Arthrobacter sulfonylureivorans]UNK45115.1 DUF6318 family protein [Arthrobacter sulfonylureivorans]